MRAGAFSCFFGGFIRIPLSKMAGALPPNTSWIQLKRPTFGRCVRSRQDSAEEMLKLVERVAQHSPE